jgi:hypothetical protein
VTLKRSEVSQLLRQAARVDRWVEADSQAVVDRWWELIGGDEWLTRPLAEAALDEYYRDESRTVMPADILRRAEAIRHRMLARTPMPPPPAELLTDLEGWRLALAAAEAAIIAGQDPAGAMEAVAAVRRRELTGGQP